MTAKLTEDRAIAKELRAIRRTHAARVGEPDAERIMERLASLRVKFRQLDSAIQEAGGAKEQTAGMVAELRQLSRACSALEQQLSKPTLEPAATTDAIALMAATRRMLIERARARKALEGQATAVPAEPPFSVAALLQKDGGR